MTPPLILRDEEGCRSIIEVDDSFSVSTPQQTPRVTAFLRFAPGVIVEVKSRCVNKRRVQVLCIGPGAAIDKDIIPQSPALGVAFREFAGQV
jgi:hypothetical protein